MQEHMKNSINRCQRNKLISVVVLPFIIPFWIIGWILYCIGSRIRLQTSTGKNQVLLQKTKHKRNAKQEISEPQMLS
jgi:hypothetical protein